MLCKELRNNLLSNKLILFEYIHIGFNKYKLCNQLHKCTQLLCTKHLYTFPHLYRIMQNYIISLTPMEKRSHTFYLLIKSHKA